MQYIITIKQNLKRLWATQYFQTATQHFKIKFKQNSINFKPLFLPFPPAYRTWEKYTYHT